VTGKIGRGWNIGFLNALTNRENATIKVGDESTKQEIEPFSYYGVLRAQKEFNQGNQGLGFIATSVIRDFETDELAAVLPGKALVERMYPAPKKRSRRFRSPPCIIFSVLMLIMSVLMRMPLL